MGRQDSRPGNRRQSLPFVVIGQEKPAAGAKREGGWRIPAAGVGAIGLARMTPPEKMDSNRESYRESRFNSSRESNSRRLALEPFSIHLRSQGM
jgi:hypothetical protein